MLNQISKQPTPTSSTNELGPLVDVILSGPMAKSTRSRYQRKLRLFLAWWMATGRRAFGPALVTEYLGVLKDAQYRAFDINHSLTALKMLARQAAIRRWIDSIDLDAIVQIRGPKVHATKIGEWLDQENVPALMALPDRSTLIGKRDYVIMGLLLYGGLRATEAARVRFEHLQVRDGRPVLVNFLGKGEKERSVAIPVKLFTAIQEWVDAAGLTSGYLIRSLEGHSRQICTDTPLHRISIWKICTKYTAQLGKGSIGPHDLRRTKGRIARNAGVALDQIQQDYGHSSIDTTRLYIGGNQDFRRAPCDSLPPLE
jgi:integrase